MLRALLVLLVAASAAYGSGGSSELEAKPAQPSPEERAIGHYNQGLEHRDKAWEYERKAAEAKKEKDRDKRLQKARGEYEWAIEEQLAATSLNPHFHEAFSSLGYAYRKVGQYAEGLKAYDRALELAPHYAEAIEYRAETYLGLVRLAEVQTAYEQLFLRDPERAAQLLVACAEWVSDPPEGVEALVRFKGWVEAKEETAREMGSAEGEGQKEW